MLSREGPESLFTRINRRPFFNVNSYDETDIEEIGMKNYIFLN